jgi:hypothetical protein
VNAPDGSWLYFLDAETRMLARIDPVVGTVDRKIGPMSPGASQFCVTPDGKKIFCCSRENIIEVVDAEKFEYVKDVRISEGNPVDIAATDKGMVYLVGPPRDGGKLFAVDLTRGDTNGTRSAVRIGDPRMLICNVLMLPGQRAAVFSGTVGYAVCGVIDEPTTFSAPLAPTRLSPAGDPYPNRGGEASLSPDGKLLIHNTGVALTIE